MNAKTWGTSSNFNEPGDKPAESHKVELIGTQLCAGGTLCVSGRQRLSDYVNVLEGFFRIEDVVLRARNGDPTRVVLPEVRIRLDDITIVGQTRPKAVPDGTAQDRIEKLPHRIVVMTAAHEIYGYVHLHELGSVTAFVDASYPRFIPMTNVHVRWLSDRRLAGRFDFALLQRCHIIGVATVTGRSRRGPTLGPGRAARSDLPRRESDRKLGRPRGGLEPDEQIWRRPVDCADH
jgi:hypothetical protein